ncbi:Nif11-like leader peptide family RiPP precursor [Jiella marina]|uniref:Nif11-like leader peptide family RiPP precursor n=1 Tax=Jiella sp. LLJ827 TaxID=2917712 RepID=UPI002100CCC3|nr:Nif11-like leader peptide family RiPP precursor [Jiella sp. LLJ827]MCQ0988068.1 Nif11-like leader peptide family RiPP precursor [Jiella sp. LLJ827]
MSNKTLNDFAAALRGDETLSAGLASAIGRKRDAEAAEAFVVYGREHGFDVTAEDAEAYRQAAGGESSLTDEELDAVAGAGYSRGSRSGAGLLCGAIHRTHSLHD